MKALLSKWSIRLDAMSLRERGLVFLATAAAIVFIIYALLLSPLFLRQAALQKRVAQLQNNIAGIDDDIARKVDGFVLDPDVGSRARLTAVKEESRVLGESLRAMQQGLVAPERMAPLLERILRANGRLKLVGLTTLPVVAMNEGSYDAALPAPASAGPLQPGQQAAPAPAPQPQPVNLLFRHGVQLSLRGNYLDMVAYMQTLEHLPTQLFWGKAALAVESYPNATLTLTLYTLSLDKKWVRL